MATNYLTLVVPIEDKDQFNAVLVRNGYGECFYIDVADISEGKSAKESTHCSCMIAIKDVDINIFRRFASDMKINLEEHFSRDENGTKFSLEQILFSADLAKVDSAEESVPQDDQPQDSPK